MTPINECLFYLNQPTKSVQLLGMVADFHNPGTLETKAGGSLQVKSRGYKVSSRPI